MEEKMNELEWSYNLADVFNKSKLIPSLELSASSKTAWFLTFHYKHKDINVKFKIGDEQLSPKPYHTQEDILNVDQTGYIPEDISHDFWFAVMLLKQVKTNDGTKNLFDKTDGLRNFDITVEYPVELSEAMEQVFLGA